MSIRKGSRVIAGYIDDSDVVHKTGNETISGIKTFTSNIKITGIDATSGIESIKDFEVYDTDGSRVGLVRVQKNSADRRYTGLNVCSDTNVNVGGITVSCAADGTDVKCNLPAETWGTNFHGTATTALWADLAEKYQSDQEYAIGTLICFGGKKDITVAKVNCNGVISDKPGFILDSDLENAQPVALVGKTPIRILGKVKKFDRIVLDPQNPGIGKVQTTSDEKVIAIALEASEIEEEKLVLCVTKFNLD